MLKKIPACLSPALVKALMEMGEGEDLLLAQRNFPAGADALRADGLRVEELLAAVLELFPLDDRVRSATVRALDDDDAGDPPVWNAFQQCILASGEPCPDLDRLEKYSFENRCARARCVVVTGDADPDASILLTKGRL